MFWHLTGLYNVSTVDTIMDKGNFTLEELLDEDEIIQECKALNGRLINFLRERTQVEQLVRYIVEEAPEDAVKGRTFKFPFIACEIFTCEVDIILQALVEDDELMNLLFSFLEPEHSHTTLLAGYFSKVVLCLLLRKLSPLMSYIQAHPDIVGKLVDLIGITSIMELLIRLIADEYLYTSYSDSVKWLQDIDVLEMIVNTFSSSDSPEVHANAAESLCAIIRNAPPGLDAKISSPSFIARLFHHALQDSRPKSVLVYSLSVCISLLDPKRVTSGTHYIYNQQFNHELVVKSNPEIVERMLESLDILLKLLDVSTEENILLTTYGKLQPPLGKHRLKIVEFISVLISTKSEAAEKELIRLGVLRRILELFFQYPYNNFLHNHVEQIVVSCLASKNASLVKHILEDCNLVRNIIDAERNGALSTDKNSAMPTVLAEGKVPPRIGNVGHMTNIANTLVQLEPHICYIYAHLKDHSEWAEWHTNVLMSRNALANVYDWTCGRPDAFHELGRDSDDDYQDRDYDVAALANNLSQAFRYGIYENDTNNEDDYFDDESAEVIISSLGLGDDRERGSLFANSNWFEFEEENVVDEVSAVPPSTDTERIADTSTSSNPPSTDTTNVNNLANDSRPNVPLEQTDSSVSFDPNTNSSRPGSGPGPSCSTTNDSLNREVESNPETHRDNKPSEISTSPPHVIDAEVVTEPQQEPESHLLADGSTDHEEEI